MRRITRNSSGGTTASKIISTNNIFVGTDANTSLQTVLDKQQQEIQKIKQYTKWYIKYGGMGNGSGGSSTGSTGTWDYEFTILKGSEQFSVTSSAVTLNGFGEYSVQVTVKKSQGYNFQFRYTIGNSSEKSISFPSGTAIQTFKVQFSEKTTFSCYLYNMDTDEYTDAKTYSIIPKPFDVSLSLLTAAGAIVDNNSTYTFSTLNSLHVVFNATVLDALKVKYALYYKFKGEDSWNLSFNGYFNYDEGGAVTTTVLDKELGLSIDEERDKGKDLMIAIGYGLDASMEDISKYQSQYTVTVIPNEYWIVLTDATDDNLYTEPTADYSAPENCQTMGLLTYNLQVTYIASTSVNLTATIERYSNGVWEQIGDNYNGSIKTNSPSNVGVVFNYPQVSTSGWHRITVKTSGSGTAIGLSKYFYCREISSSWSFTSFRENETKVDTYYPNQSEPFFNALSLYGKSVSINHAFTRGANTNYAHIVNLGFQYDSSNDPNNELFRVLLGDDKVNYLKFTQEKILYCTSNNEEELISYYLPSTDSISILKSNEWHLLTLVINPVSKGEVIVYNEVSVFIDGEGAGIAYTSNDVTGYSTLLDRELGVSGAIINQTTNTNMLVNLLHISTVPIRALITTETLDTDLKNYYKSQAYNYDSDAVLYFNQYKSKLNISVFDTGTIAEVTKKFKFDNRGIPYTDSNNLIELLQAISGDTCVVNAPILVLFPKKNIVSGTSQSFFENYYMGSFSEDVKLDTYGIFQGPISYLAPTDLKRTQEKNPLLSCLVTRPSSESLQMFGFKLQGSSTLSYGSKNLEMSVISEGDQKTVYTPNFDNNDKNTFLPESSYTLKADAVDSSACNNNAIGAFINDYTIPLDESNCPARKIESISKHIKNCLTGFPVLLFVCECDDYTDKEAMIGNGSYYFLGIYNFNLGRKSFFNLGYYKDYPDEIKNLTGNGSFQVLNVTMPSEEYANNFVVTEISNNNQYFDFSQYDPSVLFAQTDDDNASMFSADDTYTSYDSNELKNVVGGCVSGITEAGGWIFSQLGKHLVKPDGIGSCHYAYNMQVKDAIPSLSTDTGSYNAVPDYRLQYKRTINAENSGSTYYLAYTGKTAETEDIYKCLCSHIPVGDDVVDNNACLDLRATVEYYVICMLFGMVDSPMKNLELKSWSKTLFPAFYDMDTALGVDNNGEDTNYFAFSDYWENSSRTTGGKTYSEGVNIYPDYFNQNGTEKGFDVPSSYLFAIAKYATMENLLGLQSGYLPEIMANDAIFQSMLQSSVPLSPINLYALLRNDNGPLASAEKFISNYFSNRLEGIPLELVNLNFRSKYMKPVYWNLDDFKVKGGYVISDKAGGLFAEAGYKDITKYKGTGKAKKTTWLNSRLRLLDAYFNLNSNLTYPVKYLDDTNNEWVIKKDALSVAYTYPSLSTNLVLSFSDSLISKMLISGKGNVATTDFYVTAQSYTPLIWYVSGVGITPYLVGDDNNTPYYLELKSNASDWYWYGSQSLTSVSNLASFQVSKGTYTSSKLIDVIFDGDTDGTRNKQLTDFTLDTPNVETIKFKGYRNPSSNLDSLNGDVKFSSNIETLNRLKSVDLTNSNVSFTIEDRISSIPLQSINLTNVKSTTISIPQSVTTLASTGVTLTNATVTNLSLPCWKNNIKLTSKNGMGSDYVVCDIQTLKIDNSSTKLSGSSVTIDTMDNLNSVILYGIEEVVIKNCKNLKVLNLNNAVKKLTVYNCSSNLKSNETFGTSEGSSVIDLAGCANLSYINMQNTQRFTDVKVGVKNVTVPNNGFNSCINLQYLSSVNGGSYLISGNSVFANCPKFTLKDSSSTEEKRITSPIYVNRSVTTNLSYLFYNASNKGVIEFEEANNFISQNKDNVGNVSNINYMFYNNNIVISAATDYFININAFSGVTQCYYAFGHNHITYWTKELFNFGTQGMNYTGAFGPEDKASVRVDFLANMGPKITSFSDFSWNYSAPTYVFVDSNDKTLESVNLRDVLKYLTNATSITGFRNIASATTIDMKNAFDDITQVKSLSEVTRGSYNKTTNWIYDNGSGQTTSCLQCLTGLTSINLMFSGDYYKDNGVLDLFNLFSQNQWKTMSNICSDSYTAGSPLSAYKTITFENYKLLQQYLRDNSNLAQLGPIFRKCTVTDCTTNEEDYVTMQIPYINSRNYTTLYNTWNNFKAKDTDGNEIPVKLGNNWFKYLRNLTTCYYTFSGTWIKNCIEADFFKKKSNEITTDAYIKKIVYEEVDEIISKKDTNNYLYAYIKKPIEETPDEVPVWDSISGETTDAKGYTISESFGSPDATNKYVYVTYVNLQSGETYSTPQLYSKWEEPTHVTVKHYTYAQTLTGLTGMFYNCLWEIPFFSGHTESGHTEIKETTFIDDNGNHYPYSASTTWYTNAACTGSYLKVREGTEYDDLSATCDITQNCVMNDVTLSNYELCNPEQGSPFVAPDFLYAAKSNANIEYLFGNSTYSTNAAATEDKYVLEGYIPSHFFKYVTSPGKLTNWISNLNILPQLMGSYTATTTAGTQSIKCYSFVPDSFLGSSVTDLTNAFNFRIRIPSVSNTAEKKQYFIMCDTSVAKTITSLKYGLPRCAPHFNNNLGIIGYSATYVQVDVVKNNYDFNYYLTYNKENMANGGLDKFTSLVMNHIISADLIYILCGNLFTNDAKTISNIILTTGDDAIVDGVNQRTEWPEYHGVNKNFLFPAVADGQNTIPKLINSSKPYMSKATVQNYTEAWQNAYNCGSEMFIAD